MATYTHLPLSASALKEVLGAHRINMKEFPTEEEAGAVESPFGRLYGIDLICAESAELDDYKFCYLQPQTNKVYVTPNDLLQKG